jgi:hypothetical protein
VQHVKAHKTNFEPSPSRQMVVLDVPTVSSHIAHDGENTEEIGRKQPIVTVVVCASEKPAFRPFVTASTVIVVVVRRVHHRQNV